MKTCAIHALNTWLLDQYPSVVGNIQTDSCQFVWPSDNTRYKFNTISHNLTVGTCVFHMQVHALRSCNPAHGTLQSSATSNLILWLFDNPSCNLSRDLWRYGHITPHFFIFRLAPGCKSGQCDQNNRDILHHKVSNKRYGYPLSVGTSWSNFGQVAWSQRASKVG